jgi:hypothetical protein
MNITKKEIQQIIKEEYETVLLERLMLDEQARIDKLHEEMQLEVLSEGWKEELPHIGLDVLGLIPGVGEAADLTNAGLYAKKGEYLMAALSVISMIPAVGDALGKGGKIGAYLSKFGAKGGTKAGAALGKLFGKHMPKITKALSSLKSNKLIGPYIDDMAKAVTKYADDLGTKAADEILPQLQKAVGVAAAPKVSKNKYMAIAQKANTKRVTRQNRQAIAQNLSGGEGEEQAPAAAPAAAPAQVPQQQRAAPTRPPATASTAGSSSGADKIKSDADDILKQVARRQKVAENKKMDVINKMLSAIEQFGNDPEVIDILGTDGLSGALEAIKDKILSNQDAEEDGTSLTSIMEKELTKPEKKEKEKIVKGMKKDKKGFKQRYGDDAESVMYATATKLAKEKK